MLNARLSLLPALFALTCSGTLFAATITPIKDNFTGTTAANSWMALNYACLTAGNQPPGPGAIPACTSPTDAAGSGALRLTPALYNQTGAILSNFSFPSTKGLQVTFTTYTYGGDSGGAALDGADGIGFFLTDGGTTSAPTPVLTTAGALGGSLGYSCSNSNSIYNGLADGYLGLGIDEYGNFLNSGDNTSTGILNTNSTITGVSTANGTNSFSSSPNATQSNGSGRYYQPNRIGLRGAGNVNWAWLSANYPNQFPSSSNSTIQKNLVTSVCRTGAFSYYPQLQFPSGTNISTYSNLNAYNSTYYPSSLSTTQKASAVSSASSGVWNYSSPSSPTKVLSTTLTTVTVPDYAAIPGGYWVLPSSQLIAAEGASTRTSGWPITYKLTISDTGLLTFLYSYNGGAFQPVLTNQSITASNGPLPSTFRFGFSAATGGSINVHEITCFQAQTNESASSVGANTIQSGQVKTGTQIYLAYYNSNNWWGSLVSDPLVVNSSGTPSVATANWDANCVLTGGACTNTGITSTTNPAQPTSAGSTNGRQLLTWDPSALVGIPLEWLNITTAQKTILNSTDSLGTKRLDWLRGDRTQEQLAATPGPLRARTSVLGDIINSSPTWVGGPDLKYTSPFNDAFYGGVSAPENATGAQPYSTYASNMATRTNVVYSGSNDGLLHGFRSGNFKTDGSYDSTNNDGLEVIGFMPSSVLANANVVGLTDPLYSHSYFVDATPGTGDLFYNGTWHTWLVGGLGTGGAEIYALDISDPSLFSETNASTLVRGDWTAATLTCVTTPTACGSYLGNTVGTPLIRRLHNGQWAIIFGNGIGSSTGHAGIFIGLVTAPVSPATSPTLAFRWLDTGIGSSTNPNGIAYVASADLDGDHVTDYLYAGDLLGNAWRFDLTSSNPVDWAVSQFGGTSPTPLFTAKVGTVIQPITTKIAVAATNTAGANRVIVMFGTGQKTPVTATASDTYSTGTQTVYGIWDWDMTAWNNGSTTASLVTIPASGVSYGALTGPPSSPIARADLLSQVSTTTLNTSGGAGVPLGFRTISSTNNVCWQGSATCTSPTPGNNQYGWYFDLPTTNEQAIYNPIIEDGALVLNTTIPPSTTAGQCNPTLETGWTMAFNINSGGGLPSNFFANSSGSFAPTSSGSIAGIMINAVGTTRVVTVGNVPYLVTQTSDGTPNVVKINPQNGISARRISWKEIR